MLRAMGRLTSSSLTHVPCISLHEKARGPNQRSKLVVFRPVVAKKPSSCDDRWLGSTRTRAEIAASDSPHGRFGFSFACSAAPAVASAPVLDVASLECLHMSAQAGMKAGTCRTA